jgi:tyrosine-protein kinase Etk/Wzc
MIIDEHLDENVINIRQIINKYSAHWKYFVLSLVFFILLCFFYLKYTSPIYNVTSSILVKDEDKGISNQLNAFSEIGFDLNGNNLKLENEIELLNSRSLLTSVVESLNLNVNYFDNKSLFKKEFYKNSPIKVSFINKNRDYSQNDFLIEIKKLSNSKLRITDKKNSKVFDYSLGESIPTFLGEIVITPTAYYNYHNFKLLLSISNIDDAVNNLKSSLSVELVNKESSILSLSLNTTDIDKGKAILNKLIKNHSKDAINDKIEVSISTLNFIKNRIKFLTSELSIVEEDVSKFKSKNKIINFESDAELFIEKETENQKLLSENQIQMELNDYILNYIKTTKTDELLPYNVGITNKAIDDLISNINNLIIERNRILVRSSSNNPIAINIDNQVYSLKSNLKESLISNKKTLKITNNLLNSTQKKLDKQLNSAPNQEKDFREISRQQQIKETLYLFLLQKREETSLQLAVATSNTKQIDKPYCTGIPLSPNKKVLYIIAFILGILTPVVFIYINSLFDSKIKSKLDITNLGIPYIGDIPISLSNEKLVVSKSKRTNIAEAFRFIRTNIDFLIPSTQNSSKSILITSTLSNEGKSFIALNLAATLSLSNKKVALVGLDLRVPKILEYVNEKKSIGVSSYIIDKEITLDEILFKIPDYENLTIISSGPIPPNPAELLMSDRLNDLFEELKTKFDYIVVDTAPVGLVTDSLLLNKYADLFIYVSRANYLDKRLLNIPKNLYDEGKLKNMTILLNCSDPKSNNGYGYSYGYGDDISYLSNTKKSWFSKFP